MIEWASSFGQITVIGVEGSGQYGAGLVRYLVAQGFEVREVPAHMTFVERKRKPSQGKTDPLDGLRIARVVLREGQTLPLAARNRLAIDLKAAVEYRDQLVKARTQRINRTHALLSCIRPGAFPQKKKLATVKGLAAIALVRGDRQVQAKVVRLHVDRFAV